MAQITLHEDTTQAWLKIVVNGNNKWFLRQQGNPCNVGSTLTYQNSAYSIVEADSCHVMENNEVVEIDETKQGTDNLGNIYYFLVGGRPNDRGKK